MNRYESERLAIAEADVARADAIVQARVTAFRDAANMADREGHAWSGAPAHSFFQLAERLRGMAQASMDSERNDG